MSSSSTPLPSPCTGICKLDKSREYCQGCLRTPKEITDWPVVNNKRRMEILRKLQKRRADLGMVRERPSKRIRKRRGKVA